MLGHYFHSEFFLAFIGMTRAVFQQRTHRCPKIKMHRTYVVYLICWECTECEQPVCLHTCTCYLWNRHTEILSFSVHTCHFNGTLAYSSVYLLCAAAFAVQCQTWANCDRDHMAYKAWNIYRLTLSRKSVDQPLSWGNGQGTLSASLKRWPFFSPSMISSRSFSLLFFLGRPFFSLPAIFFFFLSDHIYPWDNFT